MDIKYEDYPFTPTSMASQHSWCALSQAWAACQPDQDALLTPHNSLCLAILSPSLKGKLCCKDIKMWHMQDLKATCVGPLGLRTSNLHATLYTVTNWICQRSSPGSHISLTRTKGIRTVDPEWRTELNQNRTLTLVLLNSLPTSHISSAKQQNLPIIREISIFIYIHQLKHNK